MPSPETGKKAVSLLSGGLDSGVCLLIAGQLGFSLHALSFNYGQRHLVELNAARRVAQSAGVASHVVLDLPLRRIGGSALTADISVPRNIPFERMSAHIPITYVPARNTVFLALALALAESIGAFDIFIGVNALDYSGYPDCRPEFIKAFEHTANLATKAGVEGRRFTIHTPLISLDKAGIVLRGLEVGLDFALTHSCYDPSPEGVSCGACDSCRLRLKGFREAGITDPIAYQASYALTE